MNGPLTLLPHCVLNMGNSTSVGAAREIFSPRMGNDAVTAVTGLGHMAIGGILNAEIRGSGARERKLTGSCRGSAHQRGCICRTSRTA